ncbi:MAG: hypothetical protein MZV64_25030 [Ignavibacteriales bacterium]|nr:hypothetical protein [Ignavibacteriales bacterium]
MKAAFKKELSYIIKHRKKDKIKAFINVGGGISSIGSVENAQFIPNGLSKTLPMKNFPVRGLLIQMAEKNIPVIHLLNVNQLAQQYGLPANPTPLPRPGEGEIFIQKRYSVLLTSRRNVFLSYCYCICLFYGEKAASAWN